ncbi:MAG: hypothetical protein RLZZ507_2122 [Cyanobacteriota bacterium]|jgi:hypothetical protein
MREMNPQRRNNVANLYPVNYKGYIRIDVLKLYLQTGECNDPRLKGILLRLHQGETLLSPKKAEDLLKKLSTSLKLINIVTSELLGESIPQVEALGQLQCENESFCLEVETKIRENLQELDFFLNQLLEINKKYGYLAYDTQPKKHPQNLETFQENLDESKELVKTISYIQRYLNYQFNTTQSLFDRTAYPLAYFLRIRKYLEILPGECRSLAAITRQAIANRVPGTESDNLT